MWALLDNLSPDVLGQHVLSKLGWRDIVHLDSAIICKKWKSNLNASYPHVTFNLSFWGMSSNDIISALRWCVSRGLQIATLPLSGDFGTAFQLLQTPSSRPIAQALVVSCYEKKTFVELEEALAGTVEIGFNSSFALHLQTHSRLEVQNLEVFRGRLTGLSWDADVLNVKDADALVQSNRTLTEITIGHATIQDLQIGTFVGASLRSLNLCCAMVDDAHLALLGQSCCGLTCLTISRSHHSGRFHTGLVRLATHCLQLQSVDIRRIDVSDEAVMAICANCAKLDALLLPLGFLTSGAIMALCVSRATVRRLHIGWKVTCLAAFAADAPFLCCLQDVALPSVSAGSTHTLGFALARMPALRRRYGGWVDSPVRALTRLYSLDVHPSCLSPPAVMRVSQLLKARVRKHQSV